MSRKDKAKVKLNGSNQFFGISTPIFCLLINFCVIFYIISNQVSYLKIEDSWLLIGCLTIIISSIIYQFISTNYYFGNVTNMFRYIALFYVFSLLLGLMMITIYITKLFVGENIQFKNKVINLNIKSMLYHLFTTKKYRQTFIITSIIYSIIFSLISGIVIYQPNTLFSQTYFTNIPAIKIIYCCGNFGQYPNMAIYITEHVGLMLIPLTFLILLFVSILVGINIMLISFAINNRPKRNTKWFLSIAAITGLFTGCPTCAGLFIASILPGTFAISSITIVSLYYQKIFIIITVGLLIFTAFLSLKNVKTLFEEGCIIENTKITK